MCMVHVWEISKNCNINLSLRLFIINGDKGWCISWVKKAG